MAAKTNKSIVQLSRWALNPQLMERFIQIARLSQRTAFIREVLLLEESDAVIKMQVQNICEQHGMACKMPRGNSYVGIHVKSLKPVQRLHASYLINLMLSSEASGLSFDEGIRADEMLDRMLICYHKYLGLYKLKAESAELSFEYFHFLYRCYKSAAIDLTPCGDCGSKFVNLRVHLSIQCPLCERLQLARMPNGSRFTGLVRGEGARYATA